MKQENSEIGKLVITDGLDQGLTFVKFQIRALSRLEAEKLFKQLFDMIKPNNLPSTLMCVRQVGRHTSSTIVIAVNQSSMCTVHVLMLFASSQAFKNSMADVYLFFPFWTTVQFWCMQPDATCSGMCRCRSNLYTMGLNYFWSCM